MQVTVGCHLTPYLNTVDQHKRFQHPSGASVLLLVVQKSHFTIAKFSLKFKHFNGKKGQQLIKLLKSPDQTIQPSVSVPSVRSNVHARGSRAHTPADYERTALPSHGKQDPLPLSGWFRAEIITPAKSRTCNAWHACCHWQLLSLQVQARCSRSVRPSLGHCLLTACS